MEVNICTHSTFLIYVRSLLGKFVWWKEACCDM